MWEYHPPDVHHNKVEPVRELPMGFVAHFRVVARFDDTYVVQGYENTDLYAWFKPISGPVEWLRED